MGHKKGVRKRERELVERALGLGDSGSVCGVDEGFPFEELGSATVFGVCPCCGSALVERVDGFGCPHGCVFVSFSK